MKYVDQVDVAGKRVFLRVDFNVPMDDKGNVTDDTRIKAHLPTIRYLIDARAKLIIGSHLGRPKGKRSEAFSLKAASVRLRDLLGREVVFADDCVGEAAEGLVDKMNDGDVVLLENLRFHIGEEKNDPEFARLLARLCDVYIDDAFAVSHRKAASNYAITEFVSVCAAGFLLKDEIEYFNKAMGDPSRPFAAIIGGAKVSDKIGVLDRLVDKVDQLFIGGGMAFTFLRAQGKETGKSLCEQDMLDTARAIMEKAAAKKVTIHLPVDCVVAPEATASAPVTVCSVDAIPKDSMGLDIGPATIAEFSRALGDVKTVVWNGPMGMFEVEAFSKGTFEVAKAVAASGALSIIGGGDTDAAVHKAGVSDKVSYISTGGGAFLEMLEGKTMPAIEALQK